MDNWILKSAYNLVNEPRQENKIKPDEVKVKVTHLMVSTFDSLLYSGELKAAYPKTIGRFAIGVITECGRNCYGLEKGMRVCLQGTRSCGECLACRTGKPANCVNIKNAGKEFDGFLRDFVVCRYNEVAQLPDSVNDFQALNIESVALGERVYDRLDLPAGKYVAVIGCNPAGIIVAQVLQFHKLIPIVVDNNAASLERAKKCGIDYAFPADDDLLANIMRVTSGLMCDGSAYTTCSRLDPSLAIRALSKRKCAVICGFAPIDFQISTGELIEKETTVASVMGGYGYTDTAINMMVHGAVNLDCFDKQILTDYDPSAILKEHAANNSGLLNNKMTIFKMII